MPTSAKAAIQEVIDLHIFFQEWLDGSLPNTDAAFARFHAATAAGFTLISPDGSIAAGADTATWIQTAHGTRRGFRLWTDAHNVRYVNDNLAVVTYQEWQTRDGVTTGRISTAIFVAAPAAPNGVAWLHVQETWLPDQA
jgi:hypothetical protein